MPTAAVRAVSPTRTSRKAAPRTADASGPAKSGSSSAKRTSARAQSRTARPVKPRPKPEPSSWRWWLLPVVVLSLTAVFVATYYPVAKVQYRETRERARLRAELDNVRARNDRLAKEVARLKTPEGVEDYARMQLGLVKSGEKVGVVVDESAAQPATITVPAPVKLDSEETVVPPVGPWTAFFDSVFGTE